MDVWKRAVALSADVYRTLDKCRDFGFRDQITRSALSIPSNIAEGMERTSAADRSKFLEYARGSCGEFRTQTIIGVESGFINKPLAASWVRESRELSAMIQGLIRSLQPAGSKPLPAN